MKKRKGVSLKLLRKVFQSANGEPAGTMGGFPWSPPPPGKFTLRMGLFQILLSPALQNGSYSNLAQSNAKKPTRSCSNLLHKAIRVQRARNVQFQTRPFWNLSCRKHCKPASSVSSFALMPAKNPWRIFLKHHHYHYLLTNSVEHWSIHTWLGMNSLIYLKYRKPQL